MLVIDNGDAIRGMAEVIEKLDFTVNGYVGTIATQLADGQMHNAEADLYASGADATIVTSITVVNTDSVARTFTLYLKPSAGTSRAISPVSLDLGVGHSFYTDGQRMVVMDASGQVQTSFTARLDDLSDVIITAAAQGEIITHDGSDWVDFAVGTAGNPLISGGAGADISWFTGLTFANDGTKTTIRGLTGDYTRIGDAATTGHALNSEDDLMVTGKLEAQGQFFANEGVLLDHLQMIKPYHLLAGEYWTLQARDVDGSAFVNLVKLTNQNDPTLEFCPSGGLASFFGATAIGQQAHIVDADGQLGDITAKFNTLLSYLDADAGFGLLAGA